MLWKFSTLISNKICPPQSYTLISSSTFGYFGHTCLESTLPLLVWQLHLCGMSCLLEGGLMTWYSVSLVSYFILLWGVQGQSGVSGGQTIAQAKTRITTLCGFLQDVIQRRVYSRIDYKFLIAGHTYGLTDQAFGAIERYTSKIDTVCVPCQWYQHVRDACKSVVVIEMEQRFFQIFRSIWGKCIPNEVKMKINRL